MSRLFAVGCAHRCQCAGWTDCVAGHWRPGRGLGGGRTQLGAEFHTLLLEWDTCFPEHQIAGPSKVGKQASFVQLGTLKASNLSHVGVKNRRIHFEIRRCLKKGVGYFKNKLHRAARLTDPVVNKKISDIMSLILEPYHNFNGVACFSPGVDGRGCQRRCPARTTIRPTPRERGAPGLGGTALISSLFLGSGSPL